MNIHELSKIDPAKFVSTWSINSSSIDRDSGAAWPVRPPVCLFSAFCPDPE